MTKPNEYQGGFYAILEFIGLYTRYFVFRILQNNKTIKYLSGEDDFPEIKKKQRFYCLFVGLFVLIFLLVIIVCFGYLILNKHNY